MIAYTGIKSAGDSSSQHVLIEVCILVSCCDDSYIWPTEVRSLSTDVVFTDLAGSVVDDARSSHGFVDS